MPATLAARLIEAIGAPFDLDGHQVAIGASIGIASRPPTAADPDQLLKNADLALYRAKARRPRHLSLLRAGDGSRCMQARRALELDLRKAHRQRRVRAPLPAAHQPASTDEICGFEALLRWNHPERGLVPPLEFIPLAEETGLIVPIGEWVLRQACAEAAKWPSDISVAVNLSPVQFKMRNLARNVIERAGAVRARRRAGSSWRSPSRCCCRTTRRR